MTRETSERVLIAQISAAMASKLALPRNRDKGTWSHLGRIEALTMLQKECLELTQAVLGADCNDPASVADVEQECADVAASAAIVLDLARNYWGRK